MAASTIADEGDRTLETDTAVSDPGGVHCVLTATRPSETADVAA